MARRGSGIEIDAADHSVQKLLPPNASQRFEGIAFSPSGGVLGAATSDTNTVFLFRRKPDGRFEDEPYSTLSGPRSGLDYPHDVSFSHGGLLAVAQRAGSISIFRENAATGDYGAEPVFRIRGPHAQLDFSDGVAFVPPGHGHLAVCNLSTDSIALYRKAWGSSSRFGCKPVFELKGGSICRPDGLAFSERGTWLAVANHGNHTVSVFQRRRGLFCALGPRYGPEPVAVIRDPGLRYPHSVAFTPKASHLVVTNAGANYFGVHARRRAGAKVEWSQEPVLRQAIGAETAFERVNACNKMEGGPKGVAIHADRLAVCNPEFGIMIYPFREE